MLLLILSILLLLMIIYLLLVPIILYIDTTTNQYYAQIKGLAKASIEYDEIEIIKVHLKVLLFNFEFYPLKKINFSKKTKIEKNTTKKKKSRTIPIKKIVSVIGTFKIKHFRAEIDSGDYILNAKLFPAFTFLNYYKHTQLIANFEGRNSIVLAIENRPIRIIKSFINN